MFLRDFGRALVELVAAALIVDVGFAIVASVVTGMPSSSYLAFLPFAALTIANFSAAAFAYGWIGALWVPLGGLLGLSVIVWVLLAVQRRFLRIGLVVVILTSLALALATPIWSLY